MAVFTVGNKEVAEAVKWPSEGSGIVILNVCVYGSVQGHIFSTTVSGKYISWSRTEHALYKQSKQ